MTSLCYPFDPVVDDKPSSRPGMVLCLAVVISLGFHWGAWQVMEAFISPRQMPVPPSAVVIQLLAAPEEKQEVADPSSTAVEAPPATVIPQPQRLDPIEEKALRQTEPEKARAPPVRKSILQMTEEFVATQPALPLAPSEETIGDANIFHPRLRQALAEKPQGSATGVPHLLNNSTIADANERVGLDGKCFRLENLGGGGERRAWYPVRCSGRETTSDAMARGLTEALELR